MKDSQLFFLIANLWSIASMVTGKIGLLILVLMWLIAGLLASKNESGNG